MDLMPRVLGVASMKDLLLSLTAPLEANIGHIMAESYPGTQILCYLRYPVPKPIHRTLTAVPWYPRLAIHKRATVVSTPTSRTGSGGTKLHLQCMLSVSHL